MENTANQTMSDRAMLIRMDIKKQCVGAFEKAFDNKFSNAEIREILVMAKQEAIINNELKTLGLLDEEVSEQDVIEATSEISKSVINAQDNFGEEPIEEIKAKAIEHIESIREDRMLVLATNPNMLADDIFKIYQKSEFLKEYVAASVINGLVSNVEKSGLAMGQSEYALFRDSDTNDVVALSRDIAQASNKFVTLSEEEIIEAEVLNDINYSLGWQEKLKLEHKKDIFPVVYMDIDKRADEIDSFMKNFRDENTYIIQPENNQEQAAVKQNVEKSDNNSYELQGNPNSKKTTYTLKTDEIVAFIKNEEQLTFPYPRSFLNENNLRVLKLDLMDLPLSELKDLLQKMREKNEKLEEQEKLELISELATELTDNAGVKNKEEAKAITENNPAEENLNKLKGIYDDSKEELEAIERHIEANNQFSSDNYELTDEDMDFLNDIEVEEDNKNQSKDKPSQIKPSAHNVKNR